MTRRRGLFGLMAAAALILVCADAAAQVPGRLGPAAKRPEIKSGEFELPGNEDGATLRGGGPFSQSECKIGIKCNAGTRIIGGNTRPAFEYNFVGAIYYNSRDGYRHICSGTLVSPALVLTAGHCGCGVRGSYWINFHHDTRSSIQRVAAVDAAPILFDDRVCRTGNLGGGSDLALLQLRNPLKPMKDNNGRELRLQPFREPPELVWALRPILQKGLRLTAVGYGYSDAGTTGIRLQGAIPIVSATCEESSLRSTCSAFNEMILADTPGTRQRTDTCGGDSGGPVFLVEGNEPKLIGVTSRAAPGPHDNAALHCGGGGIYALIGRKSVHAWLKENGVEYGKGR
jgi:hypothetical protein